MLEALGVRTLGEFAALPAPSVARPLEADYQALARGEGGAALRAVRAGGGDPRGHRRRPRERARRRAAPVTSSGPAAVAIVARRIALRLAGRGRLAARLEVCRLGERELRSSSRTARGRRRGASRACSRPRSAAAERRVAAARGGRRRGHRGRAPRDACRRSRRRWRTPIDPIAIVLRSGSLFTLARRCAPSARRTRRGNSAIAARAHSRDGSASVDPGTWLARALLTQEATMLPLAILLATRRSASPRSTRVGGIHAIVVACRAIAHFFSGGRSAPVAAVVGRRHVDEPRRLSCASSSPRRSRPRTADREPDPHDQHRRSWSAAPRRASRARSTTR